MEHRDRASGWKHAKLSGHENERLLEELVQSDIATQQRLLAAAHKENATIVDIDFGGLRETNVPSVFGDTTKSKTDMHLYLSDGSRVNVSIKKSTGGQVYLIGADRFIRGFEMQYGLKIPADVKRAISLFWGTADDTIDIVNQYAGENKAYELRKHRLVAYTLGLYNYDLSRVLVDWFNDMMPYIFDFCFSRGLARNAEDWADIVWYRNELQENDVDEMFNISDLGNALPRNAEYGTRTGGSTIQLPFGFVQWHSPTKKIPGDMQFHHSYEKLAEL